MFWIEIVDSLPYAPFYYKGEGYTIIETLEKVQELAEYNPSIPYKVAVTVQGDKAQSSLLKITEEMPELLTIVYVCDSINRVSEALRSRVNNQYDGKVLTVSCCARDEMRPYMSEKVYEFITKYNIKYVNGLEKVDDPSFKTVVDMATMLIDSKKEVNIGNALKIYSVLKSLSPDIDIRTFIEIVVALLASAKGDLYLKMKLIMYSEFKAYEDGYMTAGDKIALLHTFLEHYLRYD